MSRDAISTPKSPQKTSRELRLLLRLVVAPAALAWLIGILNSFMPSFTVLTFLGFLLLELLWSLMIAALIVRALFRRLWAAAVATLSALAASWPLMIGLTSPYAGDYVHLALLYPYYRAEIRALPQPLSTPVAFDWGIGGTLRQDCARWLVYTVGGNPAAAAREYVDADVSTRRLAGNFYLVEARF